MNNNFNNLTMDNFISVENILKGQAELISWHVNAADVSKVSRPWGNINRLYLDNISKVIFNDKATILISEIPNKKVIVKRCEGDTEDREKAVMYALLKGMGVGARDIYKLVEKGEESLNNRKKNVAKKSNEEVMNVESK